MCDKQTYLGIAEQLPDQMSEALDELVRVGAQRMLMAALEAEVAEYVERHQTERDEFGHALVVRNGRAGQRKLATGAGVLEIRAPRVHDQRPDQRFTSAVLPPYMRRSPRLEEALPVLYLRGLSTGDVGPALEVLLGQSARGFSPTTVTRLKESWKEEYQVWRRRNLTFGTVKARTKKTRGAGSRAAGLAMAFKLIEAAEQRWRRVNAPQLVAAVLRGIEFKDGARVTPRPVAGDSHGHEGVAA